MWLISKLPLYLLKSYQIIPVTFLYYNNNLQRYTIRHDIYSYVTMETITVYKLVTIQVQTLPKVHDSVKLFLFW